ncbi:MAG: hypothetical protein ABL958_03120 [Bdellovibrionia bacterium]
MPLKRALAVLLLVLSASMAFADDNTQLHVRTGLLDGKYFGATSGDFQVTSTLDIDHETFIANRRSRVFRAILGIDLISAKPFYTYAGTGMRFYVNSKGMRFDRSDDQYALMSYPRYRYYFGWDAGIAQVIVRSLGKVLQVVSSMIDIGVCGGAVWQVDRDFGIDLHVGVTSGYGFSSVAVVGYTTRALLGMTYYF